MGNTYSDNSIITIYISYDEWYVPIKINTNALVYDIHKKFQEITGIHIINQPDLYMTDEIALLSHKSIKDYRLHDRIILKMKEDI